MSQRVILWAEETRSRFCTVNCQTLVRNYKLSHVGSGFQPLSLEVGGECVTTVPLWPLSKLFNDLHIGLVSETRIQPFTKLEPVLAMKNYIKKKFGIPFP